MSEWKPRLVRAGVVALVISALCIQCACADEGTEQETEEEKIKTGGQTNAILARINAFIATTRPAILSLPMACLAALFLLQWHVIPLLPHREDGLEPSRFFRQLGLNVFVFQIYYAEHFSCFKGKNFVTSISFIFFDTVILFYFFHNYVAPKVHGTKHFAKKFYDLRLAADNHFMDISRHLRMAIVCYIAQCGLVFYYVFELNADPSTHDVNNVSVLEWIFAVVIMQVTVDDEMGAAYQPEFWSSLQKAISPQVRKVWDFRLWFFPMTLEHELFLRQLMDMVINGFCRTMIIGTAPIMLCVEDHMDFVKDCTALFFILKLDDLPKSRILTEILSSKDEYAETQRSLGEGSSPLKAVPWIGEWLHKEDGKCYGEIFVHDLIEDLATWPDIGAEQAQHTMQLDNWREQFHI